MTGDLDPVKLPKGRRAMVGLLMGAAAVLGVIGALEWWLAAPAWRLPLVIAVSAAAGWVAARAMARGARRSRKGSAGRR